MSLLGANAFLYYNAKRYNPTLPTDTDYYDDPLWIQLCAVRDVSLLGTRRELDVSIKGHAHHATETIMQNATLTFDWLLHGYDSDGFVFDTFQNTELVGSYMNGDYVEMLMVSQERTIPGAQGLRAMMQVAKFDNVQPINGVQLWQVVMRQNWYRNGHQQGEFFKPTWVYTPPPP